jgi:hypothetical protein
VETKARRTLALVGREDPQVAPSRFDEVGHFGARVGRPRVLRAIARSRATLRRNTKSAPPILARSSIPRPALTFPASDCRFSPTLPRARYGDMAPTGPLPGGDMVDLLLARLGFGLE